MKLSTFTLLLATALVFTSTATSFAGDLEPSAAPAATMKTLDQVEPAVPFSKDDLPLTITQSGTYYLTESVSYTGAGTGTGNAAISIECDNVTIDLKGYTINGSSNEKSSACIYSDNFDNIIVKNGRIIAFTDYCVRIEGESAANNRVENITANYSDYPIVVGRSSRISGCTIFNGRLICLKADAYSTISDCIVFNSYGYSQSGINAGDYSTVKNCTVSFQTGYGIFLNNNSQAINCSVKDCDTYGIYASANSTVSTCSVDAAVGGTCIYSNGQCLMLDNSVFSGKIGLELGYGSTARGNQINTCTTGIDAYYRCSIDNNLLDDCSDGIVARGLNSIKNNHITYFTGDAIQINQNTNVIELNTITSSSSYATGLEITGDDNLYLNNRISSATTINITGSGNTNGGGNITF